MNKYVCKWNGSFYLGKTSSGKRKKIDFLFYTTRFKAKADTPKSYLRIGYIEVERAFLQKGNTLTLYRIKKGDYAVSTYVDGSFWEQFAKAKLPKEIENILEEKFETLKKRKLR